MLKIVLTGGPCGGKTTCLSRLEQALANRGYKMFVVPETATELILSGVPTNNEMYNINFQEIVLKKQLMKENLYEDIVNNCNPDKAVIIFDRAIMDGAAYSTKEEFSKILKTNNLTISGVLNRYDGVFHLVTIAKDAVDNYEWIGSEKCNNKARHESPEEAILMDDKILQSWVGHPHLRIFDNRNKFEDKINAVIKEIFDMLGEPEPLEKEKKYLITMPNIEELEKLKFSSKTSIVQTYLKKIDGKIERRIRQRGTKEKGYSFYYTEKFDVNVGERVEKEQKITFTEYINYLADADTNLHQIVKTRYCFVYKSHYFELDIYPFSEKNNFAILEIEVNNLAQKVSIPDFINVVKEVTGDKNYCNFSLAKNSLNILDS